MKIKKKRGQVTIFIIIALLLVAAVIVYFFLRTSLIKTSIPAEVQPIYTTFLTCLEDDTSTGISLLQSQGGYIELPEFEPGSTYMSFSSQLNFFGNPIPYWYYVSGNNIEKEQVPTKEDMGQQLENFIEDRVNNCNFNSYYEQGFEISLSESTAKATIKGKTVEINFDANLNIILGEEDVLIRTHKISIKSSLGSLYDSAKKVYDEQQKSLFLEEYAIDTLRLYAPVDGTEITCSPLTWVADEVFDDLQEAIEANTLALNTNVDANDYFILDIPINDEVRFLTSKNWPHSFEVIPSEENLLIANPVGNQPGLGIMGFCYVPYHFVYNLQYPVLVQVYSGEEIFQFPMAVIIQNNNPRQSLDVGAVQMIVPELCTYKNTKVQVSVEDRQGNPINADISYECFGNKCNIGKAESGFLSENFPQCVNGYVLANADGFSEAKYLVSTVSPGSVDIIIEKIHVKDIQLKLNGVSYNGDAIIYFTSGEDTKVVAYPEQRNVGLSEGQYEIQVHLYQDSSINIGAAVTEQCIDVPRSGILGIFGSTEERCFEIDIPEQIISQALVGGGKQNYYLLESELTGSDTIEINAQGLPSPETIEQLQDNYFLFESQGLDINLI
ncbi:MAG TPA: hypothetical protein VMV95_02230 [Bacillota bacterium]|nr:hypothetical protein [Bacillota bacterium]